MRTTLEIQNYRCFVRPTRVELGSAFTAFIGLNNAGKSTIMRFLFECRYLLASLHGTKKEFREALHTPQKFRANELVDEDELFSNLNNNGLRFEFQFSHDSTPSATTLTRATISVTRDRTWRVALETGAGPLDTNQSRQLRVNGNALVNVQDQLLADLSPMFEAAAALADTVYIGPFRNAINMEGKSKYLDIDAGASFIDLIATLRTGSSKANAETFCELSEDIRRIFGFTSFSFEPSQNPKCLHFTVNGKAYKQHELGTGLLQFIIVLANVLVKRPSYVLIDEPELGLHPKLQLDFLTTLATFAKKGIWFSTHNIGLARSVATQIYAVSMERPGDSRLAPFGNHPSLAQLLGELSYSTHNPLGFDRILLVEGSTDLVSVQQILRKMGKEHTILLLSLNGRIAGEMEIELQEISRISSSIAAVIDSEKLSATAPLNAAREKFRTLCGQLSIQCHVLGRRALENYFSDTAVKSVLGASYRALADFEHLDRMTPNWSKDKNWKLANAMSLSEWQANDLGAFLQSL